MELTSKYVALVCILLRTCTLLSRVTTDRQQWLYSFPLYILTNYGLGLGFVILGLVCKFWSYFVAV